VVFPDTSLPEPTNGGFANQEEFRNFVAEQQTGKWNSALHSRPLAEKLEDYKDDTFALCFPLQFPYGHTGMPKDPAVVKLTEREGKSKLLSRNRLDVLRKFLQHQKPCFHFPMFNLIVENCIMKQTMFNSAKMYCNVKCSNGYTMGHKYGEMTSKALERAIMDARQNSSVQHSAAGEAQFLKSIKASCKNLPHSNEAAQEARKIYFSYLMRFGLPAIFLTISPDTLRNFRIMVYSCSAVEKVYGDYKPSDFTDEQILADFHYHRDARFDHPGLCAEEYQRIIHLVIKHLFNWNSEEHQSNGIGIFGELLAWCLATEEQGRKDLHAHILAFIKDWRAILQLLQRKNSCDQISSQLSYADAVRKSKAFYDNACSAQLFQDFVPGKPMDQQAVFWHKDCRGKRVESKMRFTVKPVDDQVLREMRHKVLCHEHNGKVASCQKCNLDFTVNDIIKTALNVHFGTPPNKENPFHFPEGSRIKRLDREVYEMQKDFSWLDGDDLSKARRYFACNALVNVHYTTHANRCFKRGSECYAHLPDQVTDYTQIFYNEEFDLWSDCWGNKEKRYMFRFQPKRALEDIFVNVHNPLVTGLLGWNNNVLGAMNGASVIYVTGYQVKAQQKEELVAFEKVSGVMVKILEKQVRTQNKTQTYCYQFVKPSFLKSKPRLRFTNIRKVGIGLVDLFCSTVLQIFVINS